MTQEQLSIDSHNFSSSQLKQPHPVYTDSGQGVQPNPFPAPHKFPTSAAYRRHTEGRRGLEVALKKLAQKDLIGKRSVEEFLLDQYRQGCRPSTLRNSLTTIDGFLSFIKVLGRNHLEEIIRQDLLAYIEHEQDRGLMASTINTRWRTLKGFLRFMIEKQLLRSEVLGKRIIIKVPDTLPRAMDPQDVQRLLAAIDNVRDRAMILVLLRTAMRIGELLNTLVKEINIKQRRIDIYEAEKTRVGRVVYLSDDATAALRAWLKERDHRKEHLFYARGRQTISYPAARMRFVKCVEKAGLSHKGYSLHCLRHTCASELLNAGMPLECVQQILGHSSIEMTRRYARLTDKRRKEQYFKAMAIIERGQMNGHYQLDRELQAVFETQELFLKHD